MNPDMSDCQEERRRRDRARRDDVISLPVLQGRRHGVIDGRDGDVLACASVGPVGEVVAVWTTPEDLEAVTAATVSAAGASFPDPGAARPVAARITVHTPELAAVTRRLTATRLPSCGLTSAGSAPQGGLEKPASSSATLLCAERRSLRLVSSSNQRDCWDST